MVVRAAWFLFWFSLAALLGTAIIGYSSDGVISEPPVRTVGLPPVDRSEWNESEWINHLAKSGWRPEAGKTEYKTPDGSRVDILLEDTAYEVEWADNWKESIGQSLYYSLATNRDPGVILLMGKGNPDQERLFYLRCLAVCGRVGIKLETVDVDKNARGIVNSN